MNTTYIFSIGFTARMLVQCIKSETSGRVVSPVTFWLFSIGGALLMILYGILRRDPVIIVGQLFGNITYTRNIILLKRAGRPQSAAANVV